MKNSGSQENPKVPITGFQSWIGCQDVQRPDKKEWNNVLNIIQMTPVKNANEISFLYKQITVQSQCSHTHVNRTVELILIYNTSMLLHNKISIKGALLCCNI